MEVIDIIAALCLVTVAVVGIVIKRISRRALADLDGLGEVKSEQDDSIAKF